MSTRSCSADENEVPILHTANDYAVLMGQVQKLTETTLSKPPDSAISLNEQHNLRIALVKVKGLIGYRPDVYANYWIAGKCAYLLGDYPTAESFFYQGTEVPWKGDFDKKDYLDNMADTRYMLSKSYFQEKQYQKAADWALNAVRLHPDSADYRLAEAQAEIQLKHDDAARGILLEALQIDPNLAEARTLLHMIASDSKTKS